jgi:hypothetical protein
VSISKLRLRGAGPLAILAAACAEPTDPTNDRGDTPRAVPTEVGQAGYSARTRLTIAGDELRINGNRTYAGAPAAGLLMNVRMVNSVFEDRKRETFDPEDNTNELLKRMAEYVDHGVLAFTVSLQGGYPGYEGAQNSAFAENGELDREYMERVARVVEKADALGAVVILSLFYQRQDQLLKNEDAVERGVIEAVDWIKDNGYRNIILEIANEYSHGGFKHGILRSDAGVAGLIRLARQRASWLPVGASGMGDGRLSPKVAAASSVLLIHFNEVSLGQIPNRIEELRRDEPGKPIICNEDARTGAAAAAAASASVEAGASYGLMLERKNQHFPFVFNGRRDDPTVYERYEELTR